ncbi:hypothetical protein SVIOM342S_01808 [Streptomyces violaceorubidus]
MHVHLHHGPAKAELKRALGHSALRLGRLRVPGHVAGAEEVAAHAYARTVCGLGRSPLLLTAALAAETEAGTASGTTPPPSVTRPRHRLGLVRRRPHLDVGQEPLVRHGDVGAVNVGGPHLLHRNNSTYVVYNKDKESGGDLMITEVGNDFSRRDHLGVFYNSRASAPENGRAASPSFGTDHGVPYMIYEAGERLAGSIAMARG